MVDQIISEKVCFKAWKIEFIQTIFSNIVNALNWTKSILRK